MVCPAGLPAPESFSRNMSSASPAPLPKSEGLTEFGAVARRELFGLEADWVHLNHGSYGATPRAVQDERIRWLRKVEENPDRMFRQTRYEAFEASRRLVAELLDGDVDGLVFCTNATTGVNAAVQSVGLQPGQVVLYFTPVIYKACENAIVRECERCAARPVALALGALESRADAFCLAAEQAFREHGSAVRMLLLDQIVSGTAAHLPLEEILPRVRAAAQLYGVLNLVIVVDGAHAPGQVPVSLRTLVSQGADVFVGNLHKWLYVPKSCAVVYAAPPMRDMLRPCVVSHGYGAGLLAEFAEQGTADDSVVACVPAALEFVRREFGSLDAIWRYQRALLDAGIPLLRAAWGTPSHHDHAGALALVQLPLLSKLPQFSPARWEDAPRLMAFWREHHRLTLPVWAHEGRFYVRISAQVYVTLDDIAAARDIVAQYM